MKFLISVLKIHCSKNKEANKIVNMYEKGLMTCRDCLLALANTMEN